MVRREKMKNGNCRSLTRGSVLANAACDSLAQRVARTRVRAITPAHTFRALRMSD